MFDITKTLLDALANVIVAVTAVSTHVLVPTYVTAVDVVPCMTCSILQVGKYDNKLVAVVSKVPFRAGSVSVV